MKNSVRKILTAVLAMIFLFSMGMYGKAYLDKISADNTYSEALALATSQKGTPAPTAPVEETEATEPPVEWTWAVAPLAEEDPHIQTLTEINLEALREVNPAVIGWILIPDTKINYPLMQGEDNEYYLKHTWDEQASGSGSIFLECMNSPELTDFNTIVYGHNMGNGSMFGGLRKFGYQDYWKTHPYIYILSDAGVYRYEIFSSYLAEVDSSTYGLSFGQRQTREDFIANAVEKSEITTEITPEITDRVLTLSTCSGMGYSTRWVVHARLKMIPVQVT